MNQTSEIRELNVEEIDLVSGGIYNDGGCIPNQTLSGLLPKQPEPFHDVFAKYTIYSPWPR